MTESNSNERDRNSVKSDSYDAEVISIGSSDSEVLGVMPAAEIVEGVLYGMVQWDAGKSKPTRQQLRRWILALYDLAKQLRCEANNSVANEGQVGVVPPA